MELIYFIIYLAKSLSNEIAVHLMVYNSIEVLSRRYKNDQIFYKITYFDMNHTMEINQQQQQQVGLDEESLGIGDEYIAEIGVMNNQEYKFHNQEQFGRLLTPNEFVIFRTRMPITDNVVSIKVWYYSSFNSFDQNHLSLGFACRSIQKD